MTNYPSSFDLTEGRAYGAPAESESAGALQKFQADSQPEPPTNYVNQAAEQNKDIALRNAEALLGIGDAGDKVQGIHSFFREDLETNLIKNISQVLARGNLVADTAAGGKMPEIRLGLVGETALEDYAKKYWHGDNAKTDLSKFVFQNFKAFGQDPGTVIEGISALEQTLGRNLNFKNAGQPMNEADLDRMRQMAENAALMKLAVAQFRHDGDPKGAAALVSGRGQSVNELIKIATEFGANKENMEQLQKMADAISKR